MVCADLRERSAMGENADTLRKAYEDFNSGNMDGVLEAWADDIRWEGSNSEEVPGGGTHEGKDEVAQALARIPENFDGFQAPADEFIEDGDTVAVLGHAEGSGKSSGKDFKVPYVHVWRMEGGKGKRVQLLTDTAVIVDALHG
jgi:ketosteroid isomerase-like protein